MKRAQPTLKTAIANLDDKAALFAAAANEARQAGNANMEITLREESQLYQERAAVLRRRLERQDLT